MVLHFRHTCLLCSSCFVFISFFFCVLSYCLMPSSYFLFLVFLYAIGMFRDINQSSWELRLDWFLLKYVSTPGDSTFISGDEEVPGPDRSPGQATARYPVSSVGPRRVILLDHSLFYTDKAWVMVGFSMLRRRCACSTYLLLEAPKPHIKMQTTLFRCPLLQSTVMPFVNWIYS